MGPARTRMRSCPRNRDHPGPGRPPAGHGTHRGPRPRDNAHDHSSGRTPGRAGPRGGPHRRHPMPYVSELISACGTWAHQNARTSLNSRSRRAGQTLAGRDANPGRPPPGNTPDPPRRRAPRPAPTSPAHTLPKDPRGRGPAPPPEAALTPADQRMRDVGAPGCAPVPETAITPNPGSHPQDATQPRPPAPRPRASSPAPAYPLLGTAADAALTPADHTACGTWAHPNALTSRES